MAPAENVPNDDAPEAFLRHCLCLRFLVLYLLQCSQSLRLIALRRLEEPPRSEPTVLLVPPLVLPPHLFPGPLLVPRSHLGLTSVRVGSISVTHPAKLTVSPHRRLCSGT